MEKIYVFGHKKPDTDSVTSSIALSYLKNQLGINTSPRVLGNPNNETKFVLKYFNVVEPKYLNDVKLEIKDLNYLKDCSLYSDNTIYDSFLYMNDNNIGSIPVVNRNNKLLGLVSLKDIAKHQINDEINSLMTSYTNIIRTLNAKEILKFDDEICGKIIVTSYSSSTFIENAKINENTILIVGDRHSIIEYAIKCKVKMIILTRNSFIKDEHIKLAKDNKINIVLSNESAFNTTRKIWLSNYLETIVLKDVVSLLDDQEVDDFLEIARKNKYTNYPVINKKNECSGILRLSDINDANRKKVILVDHNEKNQSVDGIEDADIIEIIDHHKIGNIDTTLPINFRNMPVGSTNTIIYSLYKEAKISIPKEIAGLMLSGIISDTLLFRSPTTTYMDKDAVIDLSKIANINYEEYGMQMLKAGSSLKGKTKEEILYNDFKNFTIDNRKIGIGQVLTLNIDEILKDKDDYISIINKIAYQNEYHMVALFVTDIINNGSYILYNDESKNIFENVFEIEELYQGYFLDKYISRKKQIIPNIIAALEKK
ncbi:MAG: putative manganese-dependent inorganic diphosphatase [Bacilli bacterium]|nr:putative manganese-dependent inorganic diphosphatase [Bacilli bacterium]